MGVDENAMSVFRRGEVATVAPEIAYLCPAPLRLDPITIGARIYVRFDLFSLAGLYKSVFDLWGKAARAARKPNACWGFGHGLHRVGEMRRLSVS